LPIVLIALWRNRPRLFLSGTIVTGLLYLAALNIINTDELIAQENISRYQTNGKLDEFYLSTLSVDATPVLVNALDTLPAEKRAILEQSLIEQYSTLDSSERVDGWPSWHLARSRALNALRQRFGENPPNPPATYR
jgi:DNA-directed RNA polymerase specialized sigma24 family protein